MREPVRNPRECYGSINYPINNKLTAISSIDDLKRVLFLQRTITTIATNELTAVASDSTIPDNTIDELAERFIKAERKVLEKYVLYPTLTEFKLQPSLVQGTKWGATFGVTVLVGELILEQIRLAHKQFAPAVRQLYILLLKELNHPEHKYLVEPLEKFLKIKVVAKMGEVLTPEQQASYARSLINDLVETMVSVSTTYGLADVQKTGVSLTPLGKRVLLHLVDATEYIDEISKAHIALQSTKPRLSMAG